MNKNKFLIIRISESEKERIKRFAKEAKESISKIIRKSLIQYTKNN